MMPEQSNDYRVVTFGSGGVGKSSLGRRTKGREKKSAIVMCNEKVMRSQTSGERTIRMNSHFPPTKCDLSTAAHAHHLARGDAKHC